MDALGIETVTLALRDVIEQALGAGTVYVGPLDDANVGDARVVLFLYRVCANASLRNEEHVVAGSTIADPPIVHRHAMPLDLYYLVTAGTRETGGEAASLRTLGRVIQVLNAQPTLVGMTVQGEIVRVTFEHVSSDEMGRIWNLFPAINYRTSVVYVASPVWIDPMLPSTQGPPVVEQQLHMGHLIDRGAAV